MNKLRTGWNLEYKLNERAKIKGIIKLENTIIQLNTELWIVVSMTRIMNLRSNYSKEYEEIWVKLFPVLCSIKIEMFE